MIILTACATQVLECFLSWIKYTNLHAAEIAQNSFIPECFKHVVEGLVIMLQATETTSLTLKKSKEAPQEH